MPLSELYPTTKGKRDSNQDFEPGNDLFELVWEKGQVMMQAQSSRPRKGPSYSSLPSFHCLPSYNPRNRDKELGNGSNEKTGKFGNLDSFFDEIPSSSVPSGEIGMNQDEDMMPWLNYPIDDSFQQQYCPDFMPELSSVTVNELSTSNNFLSMEKRRCNQLYRNSSTNYVHDESKVTQVGHAEVTRPRSGGSQLYPLSSQQSESSFPSLRSGALDIIDGKTKSSTDHAVNYALAHVSSPARFPNSFPSSKMQNQDPIKPGSSSSIMNFSHFSRRMALLKTNIENVDEKLLSDLPIEKRIAKRGKDICASNNLPESEATNASKGPRQQTSSQYQAVDLTPFEARHSKEPYAAKQSVSVCHDNSSKNDMKSNQVPCESAIRGPLDTEKTVEPVAGSSSVCSGNSVEIISNDSTRDLKRKGRDTEEYEFHSEDAEEESVGMKKRAPARATGSKRSRAAEVHNLSERKRRDRINEKMRALQELIPNCNKVDKASMLDEAIEYLKTLQLQVQVMSMGAGLYMPPLMFPTGMQQMHLPHMAHFSPMGVGMGMGMSLGYGMCMPDMNGGFNYPMMQVPPMQGTPFPGPPMSGHNVLHGMTGSNVQVFGLPGASGQRIPMQMQGAPLHPVSEGPFVKSSMGLNGYFTGVSVENVESTLPSTSKDPMQNISPPLDPTLFQCQATNEGFQHSTMAQNNGQVAIGNKASASANGNDVGPSRVTS